MEAHQGEDQPFSTRDLRSRDLVRRFDLLGRALRFHELLRRPEEELTEDDKEWSKENELQDTERQELDAIGWIADEDVRLIEDDTRVHAAQNKLAEHRHSMQEKEFATICRLTEWQVLLERVVRPNEEQPSRVA